MTNVFGHWRTVGSLSIEKGATAALRLIACSIVLSGFALFFAGQSDVYPYVGAEFYYENVAGPVQPMTAQVPRMEKLTTGPQQTGLWIDDWQAPPLPFDLMASGQAGPPKRAAGDLEWGQALTAGLLSLSAGFGFLSVFCDRPWWL